MKRMMLTGAAIALALFASACGSNGQVAENNAAAENDMNTMMADAGPFADAEMKMNDAMMAAVGSDVGQNWAKKMIAHHQGAVDMSRVVLDQNPSAEVAKMARDAIAKNEEDIASIHKFVKDGAPDQKSAELYRPAMMDMHQKMMAASGSDVSETFMRKMLEHHKGAVTMSDVALANGVSGALRDQVQKTRSENQKDSEMVEAMLRGEPMTAPAPAASEPKAPAPAASPAAPKPAPPQPAPAKPRPAPEPKAPESTCLPEHRAAGHC